MEQQLREVRWTRLPFVSLGLLIFLDCGSHLLNLSQVVRGQTIEFNKVLNSFLATFLEKVDLTTNKVGIFEVRELINALSSRQQTLLMLTNSPLQYGLKKNTELLPTILRG